MLGQHSFHHVGLHWPVFSLAPPEAWTYAVLTQVHRGWCAIRGHDLLLHFEPRRISLSCADCGWESPGWRLDSPAPIPVLHGRLGALGLLDGHGAFGADPFNGPGDELADRRVVVSGDAGDLLFLALARGRTRLRPEGVDRHPSSAVEAALEIDGARTGQMAAG